MSSCIVSYAIFRIGFACRAACVSMLTFASVLTKLTWNGLNKADFYQHTFFFLNWTVSLRFFFQPGNFQHIKKLPFFQHAGGSRVFDGELCKKWCDCRL